MNKILVSTKNISDPEWLEKVKPFLEGILKKLIDKAQNEVGQETAGEIKARDNDAVNLEISILFCDNDFIQSLNKEYRGLDSPTDVLSFENGATYEDEGLQFLVLGDIVISLPMIEENAKAFGTTNEDERKRLLVHGLLHLLGLDHGEEHIKEGEDPQCSMLRLQEELLRE